MEAVIEIGWASENSGIKSKQRLTRVSASKTQTATVSSVITAWYSRNFVNDDNLTHIRALDRIPDHVQPHCPFHFYGAMLQLYRYRFSLPVSHGVLNPFKCRLLVA